MYASINQEQPLVAVDGLRQRSTQRDERSRAPRGCVRSPRDRKLLDAVNALLVFESEVFGRHGQNASRATGARASPAGSAAPCGPAVDRCIDECRTRRTGARDCCGLRRTFRASRRTLYSSFHAGEDDVSGRAASRPICVPITQLAGDIRESAQRKEIHFIVVVRRRFLTQALPYRARVVVDVDARIEELIKATLETAAHPRAAGHFSDTAGRTSDKEATASEVNRNGHIESLSRIGRRLPPVGDEGFHVAADDFDARPNRPLGVGP